jgi:enoyl-CoA hydratase/carnithine racemase
MRRIVLGAGTLLLPLERALSEGPAEVVLQENPRAIDRLDLVLAIARAPGPLVAVFSGDLATPLAEVALVCPFALHESGTFLDLSGALLSPLLLRHGVRNAVRLLAFHGPRIPSAAALGPPVEHLSGRSPLVLRLARELLAPPRRGALARERAAFALAMSAADRDEGIRAFRERRRPRFAW